MTNGDFTPGSVCTITHDITIEGTVAFKRGEQVTVENIAPNQQRPESKYVVYSQSLQKQFQLSDADIQLIQAPQPQQAYTPQAPSPPQVPPRPRKSGGKGKWVLLGAGILVVLIIIVAVASSGKKSEKKPEINKSSAKTTEAPTKQNQAAVGTVGQPVRVGDAEWTVLNVSKNPGLGEGSEPPNGAYIVANLKVKNYANTEQMVEDITHQLKVVDAQGRETGQTTKLIVPPDGWPQHLFGSQLGGGAELTGYVIFDVPADATGLKLNVYGWALAKDQSATINLGI